MLKKYSDDNGFFLTKCWIFRGHLINSASDSNTWVDKSKLYLLK